MQQRPPTLGSLQKECRGLTVDVHDKEAGNPITMLRSQGRTRHKPLSIKKKKNVRIHIKYLKGSKASAVWTTCQIRYHLVRVVRSESLSNGTRSPGSFLNGFASQEGTEPPLTEVVYDCCPLGFCTPNEAYFWYCLTGPRRPWPLSPSILGVI